jgi:caffeoyl-CoA O-methyltransferase
MSTTAATTTTTEIKAESQPQTKDQNGAEQQTRHSEVGHKSLLQSDALYQVRNQA